MPRVRNVLFVMADQLRADYLSCYGHPTLQTPNIDALAARGCRFTRALLQSPVCGPARMSCYTGRYVTRHGATWNNDLRDDPDELVDLGTEPCRQPVLRDMADRLFEWTRQRKTRVTMTDADVERLSSFSGTRLIGLS